MKIGTKKDQNQQRAKTQDKLYCNKAKNDIDDQLTYHFNSLSLRCPDDKEHGGRKLNIIDQPVIEQDGLKSYVRNHVTSWVRKAYKLVGPDQAEKTYQEALKNVLLSVGLIVAKEAQWKFEQKGSLKPIHKRADLIVAMPGGREKVLFELKILKTSNKFTKADLQQVIGYSNFFGVRECYLIGFNRDSVVWRLRDDDRIQVVE
jgi:GxxExxY protein